MGISHAHTAARYLEKAGLKQTKGRIAVLEVLLREHDLLTIEDIEERLKDEVHTVTLYRMLKQFVEAGIVYQTDLRSGKAYYELQHEHHHHIVCTECGLHEGVPVCIGKLDKAAQKISKQFASIGSHSLEFFGVCTKCAKR